ncbi:MAG: SCP2 sterol-binding domain-containing protein [Pseudomonadota bacterium]
MIRNTIIAGINRYLLCDQERAKDLEKIENKIISIKLREPNTTITFKVRQRLLEEVNTDEVEPDVEIIASLKILPDYFLGVDQNQFVKNGDLEINGDSHIASTFNNVLRQIEIDWEDILSKYIGDVAANQVGKGVRSVREFVEQLGDNLRLDMRDYLQDELQVAATQVEVDEFIRQVDDTSAQVDALEIRLARLTQEK